MAQPYIGEIRMTGFNFAPVGWALCDGQTLAISQNSALFQLIGTTYGGEGQTTFNLPNLQSRIPFHVGSGAGNYLTLGELSGTENVTLITSQIPGHSHTLAASSAPGTQPTPASGVWAASTLGEFSTETKAHTMDPSTIVATGGGRPHDNMPPYPVINFIISLFGVYPTQN
jgi:microcystin-dependent protein